MTRSFLQSALARVAQTVRRDRPLHHPAARDRSRPVALESLEGRQLMSTTAGFAADTIWGRPCARPNVVTVTTNGPTSPTSAAGYPDDWESPV